MCLGNAANVAAPALPASTMVVTPDSTPPRSGFTPVRFTPSNTCAWRSMRPGVTSLPPTSMTRAASLSGMPAAIGAILPSCTATPCTPPSRAAGSRTRPPFSTRSNMAPPGSGSAVVGSAADDLDAVGARGGRRGRRLPRPAIGEGQRGRAGALGEEDEHLALRCARRRDVTLDRPGDQRDGLSVRAVHHPPIAGAGASIERDGERGALGDGQIPIGRRGGRRRAPRAHQKDGGGGANEARRNQGGAPRRRGGD